MKTGDTVLHAPSGEEWVVAFVDGERLAWVGWPPGTARTSDCDLAESCTEEESLDLIKALAAGAGDDFRKVWARQYLAAATSGQPTDANHA